MTRIFSLCVVTLLLVGGMLKAQNSCKQIIGYYPSWQMYKRSGAVVPEYLDYTRYSILNYSFFQPDSNGYLTGTDPWADSLLLRGRMDWSKPQPAYYPNTSLIDFAHLWGTKVMVSIGGWTLSDNFPEIASKPEKTQTFVDECVRIIKDYQFDGIDIDWEYPCYEEHSGRPDMDKKNFTKFMYAIRVGIDSLAQAMGRSKENKFLLTAAFGAAKKNMDCIEYDQVSQFMDYINAMTYDFNGPWSQDANHNSPLYAPRKGSDGSLDVAYKMLTERCVPSSKINLGVAFYGRTLRGFGGEKPDLHASHDGKVDVERYPLHAGNPLYYRIVDEMDDYEIQLFDEVSGNPYAISTDDSCFITYDDPKSIEMKAKYVKDNNCGGVIIWDATGDYMEKKKGSLLLTGTPLADKLVEVLEPCDVPKMKKIYKMPEAVKWDNLEKFTFSSDCDFGKDQEEEKVVIQEESTAQLDTVAEQMISEKKGHVIQDLRFEYGSYKIKEGTTGSLDELVQIMNDNKSLKVKVKGYTDNIGSPAFNASLSYKRAQAVAKYIIAAGISEDRVSYRGFGLLNPRAPNKTEFGRSQNRRVEFEVTN